MSKQKKQALVPRLRFAEFREEWQTKTFNETFKIHQNNTFSRIEMNYEQGNVKNIHYGDVLIKYGCIISDTSTIPFINNNIDLTRFRKDSYLQSGDIIIADTAEDSTAGKAVEIQNVDYAILSGLHTMLCRPQHIVAPKYFGYFLNSPVYRNAIIPLLTGSKVSSISKSNISKTIIMIPKFAEQKKIADCLSSLDDLITAEDKKLATLKLHKKGLMQKLFSAESKTVPDLRFPEFRDSGDWEEKKLGDIGIFYKGRGISKADIILNGTTKCIRYGELYTTYGAIIKDVYSKTNILNSELFFSCKNDVILPSSGETKFDIATASCVMLDDIALGSDLNIIRPKINGAFLTYYLNGAKKHEIANIAQGDSVVHLYAKKLTKIEVFIPLPLEQQKIADCLSSLDDIITTQAEKIATLKTHKKGLLQGLFPSVEEVG